MSKLILLIGQSGSGKSTYVKHCLSKIPEIKYLKTTTTRGHRSLDELQNSEEYIFVSPQKYAQLRQDSTRWDHDTIYGHSYGIDLDQIRADTNYLLCVYPDESLITKIKQKYPLDVISIFIDTVPDETEPRILKERPAMESERLEVEKNIDVQKFRVVCDYAFEPKNVLGLDTVAMETKIKNLLVN